MQRPESLRPSPPFASCDRRGWTAAACVHRPLAALRVPHLVLMAALFTLLSAPADGQTTSGAGNREWQPIGLMRVRDMTPFGLSRLDMLPAYPVSATPYTFALEITYSYQNTWALSENVKDYLEQRGLERGEIGADEIAAIQALPGDAYLLDGEIGLIDLTLHYRATDRVALFATLPYFTFSGGFLDSTIENFHDNFGFGTAGRNFVPRDQFLAVADLERASLVIDRAPENELGDPVLGARYSVRAGRDRWNVALEGAVKVGLDDGDSVFSTETNDYGVQLLLQRSFRRNAFYVSLAGVDYRAPDRSVSEDRWIATLVGGWETRISKRANFILQTSVSESTVQETTLDELSATKIQVTGGLQWVYQRYAFRFGITENYKHYDNTPDIGFNLSIARIFVGSRPERTQSPLRRG